MARAICGLSENCPSGPGHRGRSTSIAQWNCHRRFDPEIAAFEILGAIIFCRLTDEKQHVIADYTSTNL
jgi:hypothetical protein